MLMMRRWTSLHRRCRFPRVSAGAFGARRIDLLARRVERAARLAAGELPDFLAETAAVREGDWQVAPAPAGSRDRRVEITGPVDRKMVINALNSGAQVFMADFEDANSPTWENCIEGQRNLTDAVDRTLSLDTGEKQLRARATRPRRCSCARAAGTCDERHFEVDGEPDLGIALRLRPLLPPQRTRAERAATSTSRSSSPTSRRGSGTTSSPGRRTARHSARDDPGDRADRDDPRRVRDGRDPLRAARPLGGAERRALGLHLQRHQEARAPARVRAAGPRAGDDGRAVHARLLRAARQDLPPPRRARDRRHGRVHPLPPRRRGQRGGAREGARGQGARGRRRASTARGSRTPISSRSRSRRSTTSSATGPTRSRASATTST